MLDCDEPYSAEMPADEEVFSLFFVKLNLCFDDELSGIRLEGKGLEFNGSLVLGLNAVEIPLKELHALVLIDGGGISGDVAVDSVVKRRVRRHRLVNV